MRLRINIPFEFRASHALPVRPQQHEHVFRLTVSLDGMMDPATGFVVDMGRVRDVVEPVVIEFDGTQLNGHVRLLASAAGKIAAASPTCETLAVFFMEELRAKLNRLREGVKLARIEVRLLEQGGAEDMAEWGWAEATL